MTFSAPTSICSPPYAFVPHAPFLAALLPSKFREVLSFLDSAQMATSPCDFLRALQAGLLLLVLPQHLTHLCATACFGLYCNCLFSLLTQLRASAKHGPPSPACSPYLVLHECLLPKKGQKQGLPSIDNYGHSEIVFKLCKKLYSGL